MPFTGHAADLGEHVRIGMGDGDGDLSDV